MKKTFPLQRPGKEDARVLDAIKQDVRKYVKRERGKPLPDGSAAWTFACRVGPDAARAQDAALKDVSSAIDRAAQTATGKIYIEIISVPTAATT